MDLDGVLKALSEQFHGGGEIPCLTEAVKAALLKNVQRRMTPQPLKIRADVELTCFAYDGVLHIQVRPQALCCQSSGRLSDSSSST